MKHTRTRHRQRGAVMIVTLLFLVILTMLGITALSSTTMEERMAGNTRDSQTALQAAEAALRDARRDFSNIQVQAGFGRPLPIAAADFGNDSGTPGTCNTGAYRALCLPATNPDGSSYTKLPGAILPATPNYNFNDPNLVVEFGDMTGAVKVGGPDDPARLARQPRYIVEVFCLQENGESIGVVPCRHYRITSRGYGRNPNTQVTVQEIFAVQQ